MLLEGYCAWGSLILRDRVVEKDTGPSSGAKTNYRLEFSVCSSPNSISTRIPISDSLFFQKKQNIYADSTTTNYRLKSDERRPLTKIGIICTSSRLLDKF
jgi:hypothetical protein